MVSLTNEMVNRTISIYGLKIKTNIYLKIYIDFEKKTQK